MQSTRRSTARYWSAPILGLLIGIVYLIGFTIGGRRTDGLIGFAVMLTVSGVAVLVGRRSETVRGLLDRQDERIVDIDLRATAVTAVAMIVAVLIGFVVEISRGHSGRPYDMIGAVGGIAYVAAVVFYRIRR